MKVKLEQCGICDGPCGELFIVIPQEVLNELGWDDGDSIEIDVNIHGDVVLNKVK